MRRIMQFLPQVLGVVALAILCYVLLAFLVRRWGKENIANIEWLKKHPRKAGLLFKLIAVLGGPCIEELIFRAPLIIAFSTLSVDAINYIWFSAGIFAVSHYFDLEFKLFGTSKPPAPTGEKMSARKSKFTRAINVFLVFPLGLLTGWYGIKYQSIWVSVAIHSAWNLFVKDILTLVFVLLVIPITACTSVLRRFRYKRQPTPQEVMRKLFKGLSVKRGLLSYFRKPATQVLTWEQRFFQELITEAKVNLVKIIKHNELDQVVRDLVEALALSGDVEAAQKITKGVSHIWVGQQIWQPIVKALAKSNPQEALTIASSIRNSDTKAAALYDVLEAVADAWELDEVRKLTDQIIAIKYPYYEQSAALLFVRQLAKRGRIQEAREWAQGTLAPAYLVKAWLAVYTASGGAQDLEAARAQAATYECRPYEQWLDVVKATQDPTDISILRAEIGKIEIKKIEDWTKYFERDKALLKLAEATGEASDLEVARQAIYLSDVDSLLMELARFSKDKNDINRLRNRDKEDSWSSFRYLLAVAAITRSEVDFLAAFEAAKNVHSVYASAEFWHASSFLELALVLQGKWIER